MENKIYPICGNCKSEISSDTEFCPVCGKKYVPLLCDNCKSEIMTKTKFCPSCAHRVKSLKEKKKRKAIITTIAILIPTLLIVLSLILFIPYEYTDGCHCYLGEVECDAKYYAEKLSGQKIYNHDCGLCINGYRKCYSCDGVGFVRKKENNFERLFY